VIKGLLIGVIVFLVGTFPATWLLMLFLETCTGRVTGARCPLASWSRCLSVARRQISPEPHRSRAHASLQQRSPRVAPRQSQSTMPDW
jgi:hypothetical protein